MTQKPANHFWDYVWCAAVFISRPMAYTFHQYASEEPTTRTVQFATVQLSSGTRHITLEGEGQAARCLPMLWDISRKRHTTALLRTATRTTEINFADYKEIDWVYKEIDPTKTRRCLRQKFTYATVN